VIKECCRLEIFTKD